MVVAATWAGADRDVASLQREVGVECSRSAQEQEVETWGVWAAAALTRQASGLETPAALS